jgi:hypothetical protein
LLDGLCGHAHRRCRVFAPGTQGHKGHALSLRWQSERSATGEAVAGEPGPADEDAAQLPAALDRAAEQRAKRRVEVEARKALFVHVRLNRVHCRVTYQVGCPFHLTTVVQLISSLETVEVDERKRALIAAGPPGQQCTKWKVSWPVAAHRGTL